MTKETILKYLRQNKKKTIYQSQLIKVFDMSQGSISKHLVVLERDGKIKRTQVHVPVMYHDLIHNTDVERNLKTFIIELLN